MCSCLKAFSGDWKHYFDCMLAPVVKQAAGAFERLDLQPAPMVKESQKDAFVG